MSFPTASWFFASDLLEQVVEALGRGCGLARPVRIELVCALDDKGFPQRRRLCRIVQRRVPGAVMGKGRV